MPIKTLESEFIDRFGAIQPDLDELCRDYDVSLELVEGSSDVDELVDRVLDEYESRLATLSCATLDARQGPDSVEEARKLRSLVLFARHAAALKEKTVVTHELREMSERLGKLNLDLQRVLLDEQRLRSRLDAVLGAIDAGILISNAEGQIERANPAAVRLIGAKAEALVGRRIESWVGSVPRGENGEVVVTPAGPNGTERVLVVARRDLVAEPGAEVVLLNDVTERDRAVDERHRNERLAELLETLRVVSHKINNPLTSLVGRAQLLKMQRGDDPKILKAAEVIEESATRVSDYVRELSRVAQAGHHDSLRKVLAKDRSKHARKGER